jgi:uncharacterized membrane protein YdjX (TVP38/TMEM64 family)
MQEHADLAVEFIEKNYFFSALLFIICYSLIIMIALPGFAPMTMLSGYIFGTVPGAIYALCGSFLGSIIAYSAVKIFLHDYIVSHYEHSIRLFSGYVHRYGVANAILVLHFLTVIPFFLINALAAIFGVSLYTFIWTTLLGCLPMVILFSFAGQELHEVESVSDIFSPTIIIIFMGLLLLAITPMIMRHFFKKDDTIQDKKDL